MLEVPERWVAPEPENPTIRYAFVVYHGRVQSPLGTTRDWHTIIVTTDEGLSAATKTANERADRLVGKNQHSRPEFEAFQDVSSGKEYPPEFYREFVLEYRGR